MFRSLYNITRVAHLGKASCRTCGETARWRGRTLGTRAISTSSSCYKRKTPEEREAERAGRKVIRYTPKVGADKIVGIWKNMTVQDIAETLNKDTRHVLEALKFADKNAKVQYKESTVIENQQIIRDIVKISGLKFKMVPSPEHSLVEEKNRDAVPAPPPPPEALRPRPPVVCVMGHVDHGKTTLLDALRHSSVVEQEFGGITQHIGAFSVQLGTGEAVTFLDTPGHAAFAAMRSRGAQATDIVLLVVAADDGVMEQTVQSIHMAKHAGVPILVAVNKMDKPGVDPKRTLSALAAHGVIAESLGGDVQAVPISARARTGLNTLVEALSLQAQLMSLKADPTGPVEGVVVEAELDPIFGKQATVLVRRGTLRPGCVLVAGQGWCKIRTLIGSDGQQMKEAPPSTPARAIGWKALPAPGDIMLQVESEKRANEVMRWRAQQRMKEKQLEDLEVINRKQGEHEAQYRAYVERKRALGRFKLRREGPREKEIKEDTHPTLRVIFKGDVEGSIEAILDVMDTYNEHDVVRLDIVHFGVGPIVQSDLDIAQAFKAIVYTFNVDTPSHIMNQANSKGVPVKTHNVIYKMIDDIKEEINQRIPMRQEEEIIGEANVVQPFMITEHRKKVCVAGSRCVKGQLSRNALYRVYRGQDVIFEGKLVSMKHLKQEVDTIKKDVECGLRLASEDLEFQPGDTIVCYKMVDAPTTTTWNPGF